ncbi:mRNA cap guanine-N7 methyltransferase [Folsomia candida]|uniref:mRNA cap guanine-N7 methyltransferase n=1 Tax=Folsomia candida TaxID=158441 RepID=UPI000B8F7E02|nr:mRNA cap guanine-N7 methyltransferase [Folsomia candida]
MSTITPLITQHYNSLQEKGIDARKDSRIFFMRSFNNWIKSMLISDTIKRIQREKDEDKDDLTVLDMCCGKGGDIQKWVKSNAVKHVVFADIAETSVEQCADRYRNLYPPGRGQKEIFSAEFVTADCTKDTLRGKYSSPDIKFDLVSVQFSFHYSFESIKQATKMLENISDNLISGGYFIGSTPNDNRIVKWLRTSSPSRSFGNDVFNIRFESEEPLPIFGAKYYFQLDEVVNCPEFLVNFNALKELASRVGLRLVYKYTFEEFFAMMRKEGQFLLERMQAVQTYPPPETTPTPPPPPKSSVEYAHAEKFLRDNPEIEKVGTLSKSEWEAVSLYVVFAFIKE